MNIRRKLRKFAIRIGIYKYWQILRYWILEAPYEIKRNFQITHRNIPKYIWLKELHNKYHGERCFVICNGPSLTKEDYIKLKDEYTFGMNYICNWFYETGIETDFFVVQDYWNRARYMKDDFDKLKKSKLFISDHIYRKYGFDYDGDCNLMPASLKNLHYPQKMRRFQTDLRKGVSIGRSVAYPCLELAYYFGFREIYLIGADCDIKQGVTHPEAEGLYGSFEDKEFAAEHVHGYEKELSNGLIMDQEIAYKFTLKSDLKIYNATRGGALKFYPRVDLDDVLNKGD